MHIQSSLKPLCRKAKASILFRCGTSFRALPLFRSPEENAVFPAPRENTSGNLLLTANGQDLSQPLISLLPALPVRLPDIVFPIILRVTAERLQSALQSCDMLLLDVYRLPKAVVNVLDVAPDAHLL